MSLSVSGATAIRISLPTRRRRTFLARKAEIESRLDTESDVDFVLDLQSLAALAGDSHTQAST